MKDHYTDLKTALADPEGVAVLGFFYEVTVIRKKCCLNQNAFVDPTSSQSAVMCFYLQKSSSANRKYDPIINALRSIKTTSECHAKYRKLKTCYEVQLPTL